MAKMTKRQYEKAQREEFDQLEAIRKIEEENEKREREYMPRPSRVMKLRILGVGKGGIFQDAYGVYEIDMPFYD